MHCDMKEKLPSGINKTRIPRLWELISLRRCTFDNLLEHKKKVVKKKCKINYINI